MDSSTLQMNSALPLAGTAAPLVRGSSSLSSAIAVLVHAGEVAHGAEARPHPKPAVEDVLSISGEELRPYLDRVLMGRHPDLGLETLELSGVLEVILPELSGIMGMGDAENRHKDVWRHTKQVVLQSVPRIAVRWAALLHDIGKAKTRTISPDGRVQFLHHDAAGARMFDNIEKRLNLFRADTELKKKIRFLVLQHQRAHQYLECWTDSAVRRFAKDMGDHLDDLMALSRADMTTKRKEKRRRYMFQLKHLSDRISELLAEDSKIPPLPKGLGQAIIDTFCVPPSKKVGDIRKALESCVETGELDERQPIEYYVDFLAANRERFWLPA